MTGLNSLLKTLRDNEVDLTVREGELVVRGKRHFLADPAMVTLLREHKSALIEFVDAGHYVPRNTQHVPPNLIPRQTTAITPAMLPLIALTQHDIDRIAARVDGGVANIQDIYDLSPLQDGILFHHLLAQAGDPYLLISRMAFASRDLLDRYLEAVQRVMDRHDILRTSVQVESLSAPAQVVWRHAPLSVTTVELDPDGGPAGTQLARRFDPRHYRIDLTRAPLLRFFIARDFESDRWVALQLWHHLIGDHSTLDQLYDEVSAFLSGRGDALEPAQPFRNLVAQARAGRSVDEHERFFRGMLGDVEEPTLPFGLTDVHRDGAGVVESRRVLPEELSKRMRVQARRCGVSLASLCHLAWGQVLARTSGREQVVFGTVMFGRMQGGDGADRAMGLFINTLPLRLDLDGTSVEESLRRTHERLAELLRHEQASLALAQRCSGVAAPSPLFSALLNYRHNAPAAPATPQVTDAFAGIEWLGGEERTNYPLALSVDDFGDGVGLAAQVVDALAPDRICGLMQRALEDLVDALETEPSRPVRTVDVLPPAERTLLLETWNDTAAAYPADVCIHRLFEQQAHNTPDALAIIDDDLKLTYAELNARANRLAHQLIARGVRPGDCVALILERGISLVVAQLAVLKTGAAYVPIDPRAPAVRQNWIVEDCGASVVLSDAEVIQGGDDSNPAVALSAEDRAYVMYTSGSTGVPKGVVVPHRAVNALVLNNPYVELHADDRVAFAANPAFDASTFEVWAPLLNGAALVAVKQSAFTDAHAFAELIERRRITVTFVTTALFDLFAQNEDVDLRGLRYLLCGGERNNPESFRRMLERGVTQHLVHCYGPTETTTFALTAEIESVTADVTNLPIGRPIANTRAYLLDAHQQPVPLGATGELYIGGAGVAHGYLNRDELTGQRFLDNPFAPGRLYRTGDLARYRADGNIEFLGRNDQQVKIRGFRIELGEIEARLLEHADVRECIVIARDKRLIAYVVSSSDIAALRDHVSGQLPDYMVPSAFVFLDALPVNANGKIDREALPEPDASAVLQRVYEAPRGEIEQTLAAIWCDLLKIERVGRHDDFFELGGHSLLAVQLLERLRRAGLGAEIRALFEHPTLAAFATTLGSQSEVVVPPNLVTSETSAITPELLPLIALEQHDIDSIVARVPGGVANIQDIYALSPLQDGVLFHHLLTTEGDPYLLFRQMSFPSRARLDQYLAAVQHVVDRHDALRTAFQWEGLSTPAQVVWRHAPLAITSVDLDPAELASHFDPRHHRIDLTRAPLLRFFITEDRETSRWHVLELMHHLIGDHSTLDVLHAEVAAILEGRADTLEPPRPFRNLIAQARYGIPTEEHERFFRDLLGDIDEPTLPYGLADVRRDGTGIAESRRMLPPSLDARLRGQARRLGVSLASLCHLAWGQVLARTSGRDSVVFGTVLFGRMQGGEGAGDAMGLFINTLPLRLDIDRTPVEESVRRTHRLLADLLRHEHASLALAQRCSGVTAPAPLFSSLLNYRHNQPRASQRETDAFAGIQWLGGEERTNYPFDLSVDDFGEALGITAQVVDSVSPERVCGLMQRALEMLAGALESAPTRPLRELDILPPAEQTLLLDTWNRTDAAYPEGCIHQLFEEQVRRTPDAIALVQDDVALTYAELNAAANRLAHRLIEHGITPDARVALCADRSPQLIAGVLAILKAGGAYVPIDPNDPQKRIAELLADAEPALLLCDDAGRNAIGDEASVPVLSLDDLTERRRRAIDENLNLPDLRSHHLAYVIYTSGSTGKPKGVMVEHRQLVQQIDAVRTQWQLDATDRILQFNNPAFDVATAEIFSAFASGARLVLRTSEWLAGAGEFAERCERFGITYIDVPYQFWRRLADAETPLPPSVRVVCVGGEALDPHTIRQWLLRYPQQPLLANCYGPTETTVTATICVPRADTAPIDSIGRPMANARIYLLDCDRRPVPLGAIGEIWIGGAGVARGYLHRPELTAARFIEDPFSDANNARMYRTGDLARYHPAGNLEFLGRNDDQIKLRGFRIELGEIEARLAEHPAIRESAVITSDERLIAYVVPREALDVAALREHLNRQLPGYMMPAAFVTLDALPLTSSGKLDRKALPAPDAGAVVQRAFEPPHGELETIVARIWCELLKLERVGRHDHFFELGGHSLLAVQLLERLRRAALGTTIRALFDHPTLADFATTLGSQREISVPPNAITPGTIAIAPEQLPLITLTQNDVDRIVAGGVGGVGNIQDIYALSPLQDGILFHHVLADDGDPYLLVNHMAFADRAHLDRYLRAMQRVVDRHDLLRTSFQWDGLSTPAQIVWRRARLSITEVEVLPDPRHFRIELTKAPLLRFFIAREPESDRWLVLELSHHLIGDHATLDVMHREVSALLAGAEETLEAPRPFRNIVAQARLGIPEEEHERFFREMLAGIDEPTLPFGLANVHGDGTQVIESRRLLSESLNDRLRAQARRLGVSLASLCHLAWGQVLARTSGREHVVFGTVLLGRMAAVEGFINTLPLRLDLDDTPVEESVRRTHRRLADLLRHEHASLALAQRCSGVIAPAPLFSALLNYRHNRLVRKEQGDAFHEIEWLRSEERTNYPVVLSVEDFGRALGLTAQVVDTIPADRVCALMERALDELADALEHAPGKPVRTLDVLPADERTLLLDTWNRTDVAYPDRCVHQLFEEQVRRSPDAIAVVRGDASLSYAQLDARANRLAHRLIALGVKPDDRIAICSERRPNLLVRLLAVLKAGAAYVPLDPSYPAERLRELLDDAQPVLVLADATGRRAVGRAPSRRPHGAGGVDAAESAGGTPALRVSLDHLAYVIYTSGSTGKPKGVMVEHRGLTNYLAWAASAYPTANGAGVLTSIAFDATITSLLLPLITGSATHLFDDLESLGDGPFGLLKLTPSHLAALNGKSVTADALIIGGEALTAETLEPFRGTTLVNEYGPTETVVGCTIYTVTPDDPHTGAIPIGRPIANTRIYLLDAHQQPVPLGAIGEVYIGGHGVARGYLDRPELTAERFLDNPFAPGRMYRTGDLVRYRPDGNLEFLGRNDQQVKIRGYRIEPGEIEARLLQHADVRECAVIARDERLIAYVVGTADVASLREHLTCQLPDSMVPSAFVTLDAFPLTPNGKLDRKALPAPDAGAVVQRTYEPPIGEVEMTIANIWRELLHIERIGRDDNFFELGGHSLIAVRLLSRVQQQLGVSVPLSTLFAHPSLRAMSAAVSLHDRAVVDSLPPIAGIARTSPLPLSFAQQRLWFLEQLDSGNIQYNIPFGLELHGALDVSALRRALDRLLARHESLRSRFVTREGQPHVEVLPADIGFPVVEDDFSLVEHDSDGNLEQACDDEARMPFDLAHGPMVRGRLFRLAPDRHVLLFVQHHIVTDGWSMGIFIDELSALYRAFVAGQSDPLPPLAIQYSDYAAWQREWLSGERLHEQFDYWRGQLSGAPVLLELPTDRPRPSEQSFAGATLDVVIDADLTLALKRLSQQHGTTLFMTVVAAWSVVLSRLSGQDDLVVGTPTANRNRREIEPLIGYFVNTLAMRLDLSGDPTAAELLARVRQTALDAQEHQDLPFEQVVEVIQPPRQLAHHPLFQAFFAWQNNPEGRLALPGLSVRGFAPRLDTVKFDLELGLGEAGGCIRGGFSYATALFDAATIERHRDYLLNVLRAMVADPAQAVAQVDLLSPAERTLLLDTWNRTETAYPADRCVHALFEDQVRERPDAIAIVEDNAALSYMELDARANALAQRLIEQGVQPGDCVATILERSIALVVAQLAILKTGAAYVPIDPQAPAERQEWIVNDCAARVVLRDVAVESFANAPELVLSAESTAYVMYTSGSTGTPKGVAVPHRAVNRLLINSGYADIRPTDRVAWLGNPAFDISTFEVWAPLLHGATLVVVSRNTILQPGALRKLVREGIDVLHLTAGLFSHVAETLGDDLRHLRLLMMGGDLVDAAVAARVLRDFPPQRLLHCYGPTETTTFATTHVVTETDGNARLPIGRPIANTRIYLLDRHQQPVPIGAIGELYVGGDGVAHGYLNRPELTAERFLDDPFAPGRMYRTGDLARYRPDGNLEFLGRNDQQVKIRGYRVEIGEIEARLGEHPGVRESLVIARDARLIAYVVGSAGIASLREHLSRQLPDYMVPAAFVVLDAFPLTANGKLDRKALPAPDASAIAQRKFEPPQGELETTVANIWCELLHLDRVGRHDHFFELGGHSLLAVQLLERLRRAGLGTTIRALFEHSTLAEFATTLGSQHELFIPPNTITPHTTAITPEQLPLIALTQDDIDRIIERVPGGIANVQDIYALSPLQDGILFHNLLSSEGDPYLLITQLAFATRAHLDRYLEALQQVVDRHDILRTAIQFEGLSMPAQVVWRRAPLSVTFVELDPAELTRRYDPRHYRIDLTQAPLLRFFITPEPGSERWILHELLHHLIGDHSTTEVIRAEVGAILAGHADTLEPPRQFRSLVAQARLGIAQEEHERFFREMLADVDEPTLPFGLSDVHRDGTGVAQSSRMLPRPLHDRLRSNARRYGVTVASLFHLAWGQVLARTSGRETVVFGTTLSGRMESSTEGAMGMFINTLPIRLDLDHTPLAESVRQTHERLATLLIHEHASLALAQRNSGVAAPTPLFSSVLNYRHDARTESEDGDPDQVFDGIEWLASEERTSYPFGLAVDDFGNALGFVVQVVDGHSPARVGDLMQRTLEDLVEALENNPAKPVRELDVLPAAERTLLLDSWNRTDAPYPADRCVHELFEEQVRSTPDAIALIQDDVSLTYAQLNAQANRLAHRLIAGGVRPEDRVAICAERRPHLVVAILAVLKAGGAYVPLDPKQPDERLDELLLDAGPIVLLRDAAGRHAVTANVIELDEAAEHSAIDSDPCTGVTARNLIYVIYTSGSTGKPKGVMVEHRHLVQQIEALKTRWQFDAFDRILQFNNPSFDVATSEIFTALLSGACLVLPTNDWWTSAEIFVDGCTRHAITYAGTPFQFWRGLLHEAAPQLPQSLRIVCTGGEAVDPQIVRQWLARYPQRPLLGNCYGPTETTVTATICVTNSETTPPNAIGRALSNTRLYVLDDRRQPVPLGAAGELYIGGAGVSRGYLHRPELTAERFLENPFAPGRMYRTGDLVRYRPDGNLEFLGRNDQQVKIRGFRIELGEIETRLGEHPDVRECTVIAREDTPGERRIVAYVVADDTTSLREHLRRQLPDYMVPAAFVALERLPLTPNGKLDRNALPAPEAGALDRVYESPQGEAEQRLATLWSELLGIEQISRRDDFFALGGHSLLMVRLLMRLKQQLDCELPLATLLAKTSFVEMAEAIAGHGKTGVGLPAIARVSRDATLPLSFAQQRLWFLEQFKSGTSQYHIPLGLELHGSLDVAALRRALDRLFARHEGLRSIFVSHDGQPRVEVLPPKSGFTLVEHDLENDPQRFEQLRFAEIHTPFDLSNGPLVRGTLIRLGAERHILLITHHHIVTDGWSMGVFLHELTTLYGAFRNGQDDPLPPLEVQYLDYAAWQRQWLAGERLEAQAGYWRNQLADAPVLLELPADRPRPAQQSFAAEGVPIVIDAALTQALRRLSQEQNTTLFMTVLAAWAAVLSRLSGQRDVVIGTVTANRSRAEVEPLIGFFVNTLALRVDLSGAPSASKLLSRVRQIVTSAQEHQDLPFEQVVEIVQPPRHLSHSPLFQVMCSWQNREKGELELDGLRANAIGTPLNTVKFDLELELGELDDCIVGGFRFATALFDAGTIQRQRGYLLNMLRAMVADPAQALDRVELISDAERTLLLETWNDTEAAYPSDRCVHELFEAQVQRTPDAIAVIHEQHELTYTELNVRANRLAHRLIERGVTPDARVVICADRLPHLIVGMLAIVKAGGAYVPLDPSYPAQWLADLLSDAEPVLALVDAVGRQRLGDISIPAIDLDGPYDSDLETNPAAGVTPRHLAYVIYTSGSTGKPKGVMVEHRSLVNITTWHARRFELTTGRRSPHTAGIGFDASTLEIWPSLASGSTIVLPPAGITREPDRLIAWWQNTPLDVIFMATPLLELALSQNQLNPQLRFLQTGGDRLSQVPASLPLPVWNDYGPAETTVVATSAPQHAGVAVSIGRPVPNARIYLLDEHLHPVPLGAVGELYIGGVGVARGYLNRPELTAERFLENPFAPGRMYRSGDLARYRADGTIDFLGRTDHQVKIRGSRVELGEIEARLRQHPDVHESLVLSRDSRLIAYVVGTADIASLRAHLSQQLPDYMIPAAFVTMEHLPLTPNGKVDRNALPEPNASAVVQRAYEAPVGGIEEALAVLWSELLGVERIGRHDHFFELGGHSLLAVRLLTRVQQQLGVALPLATLFADPTLAAIARNVSGATMQTLAPIVTVPRDEPLPLSFAQQRLWFLDQFDGESLQYHVPFGLELSGPLDVAALRRSLDRVLARHEALRTRFVSQDGRAHVELLPADTGFTLIEHDLTHDPLARERVDQLWSLELRTPFDLSRGPLVRGRLLRVEAERHVLLITHHHIVTDGWSVGVFIDEFSRLYRAFLADEPDPLPPLAIQYPDYAAWQREWLTAERVQEHADYWREQLGDAAALLRLPTDRPRPAEQSFAGAALAVFIDAELTRALKDLGRQHGTTLFITILAAWAAVLSRLSGDDDLVIGTPTANRGRSEIEPLIGFFVNTLALRIQLDGAPSIAELLGRVRETSLAAQEHQDLPFEQVVEIVQPPRSLAHSEIFQAMFAWQNTAGGELELPSLTVQRFGAGYGIAKFDVELVLAETGDCITGSLNYSTALFDAATIERQIGYLLTALRAMVTDSNQSLAHVDLLPPEERTLLLDTWNRTDAPYPSDLRIHDLFEAQVRQTPDAIAVVQDDDTLTYAELNAQANRLAHRLIARGVKPGDRVAICVDRRPHLIAGLLAILKSGGAYVPLDPTLPPARLAEFLDDAEPRLLLCDATGHQAIDTSLPAIDLDDSQFGSATLDANPHAAGLTSGDLAYIIYTSGSTGKPKGVMIEHRGVVNLALAQIERFRVTADSRVVQFASIGFDASVSEIVMTLASGATLVLPTDEQRRGAEFFDYLHSNAVTHVTLTPAMLAARAGLDAWDPPPVLILAGDVSTAASIRSLPETTTVINAYGPTEITVCATAWTRPAGFEGAAGFAGVTAPIGRPIANTRIYLLDGNQQPVPLGAIGEIYIGGAGVARGYWKRPDLTAERFLRDPFTGARMYRTGDLARYASDGNLEFLGRNDHQLKLRGFRIELGEIEARLAGHAGVSEAVVVAREERLIAYVVAREAIDVSALREHLSAQLPEYMVPTAIVPLESFPLTPSGKVDRHALPDPDAAAARAAFDPPTGEIEQILAAIWSELLGIEHIARTDHFFELGGHSLLAVRCVARLRAAGFNTTVDNHFAEPVLAGLAQLIGAQSDDTRLTRAIPVRRGDTQQPLFFVPSGLGDHAYVFALASSIDSSIPIYALPWQSESDTPLVTAQAMAARMIDMIRVVQPHGPYRLAGYSSGGVLAYAIAQHLIGVGAEVAFVGLIDVPAPHAEFDPDFFNDGSRNAAFNKAFAAFTPIAIPTVVDVIAATDSPVRGWDTILPAASVIRHSTPGDHFTMITDEAHRKELGQLLSATIADRIAPVMSAPAHPLLLRSSKATQTPIVCVPGAGDSVTTFTDFARGHEMDRNIFGLQPRGIAPGELPHYSVEAAAAYNLQSLRGDGITGPIHLLGHSYGGAVALEMARQMTAAGWAVESLTLIDADPPDEHPATLADMTNAEIFRTFVNSIELRFEKKVQLPPHVIAEGTLDMFATHLHRELLRLGIVPNRSGVELLRGPLHAFSAALRSVYHPPDVYAGECRLLVVRDPGLSLEAEHAKRAHDAAVWRRFVPNVDISEGPGNHFTILSAAHAPWLADWWAQSLVH